MTLAETKYVDLTSETATPQTDELIAIAQMFYIDAMNAVQNNYIPCFSYDPENVVSTNIPGESYVILNGISTEEDLDNTLHRFFSAKYDRQRPIQVLINTELYTQFQDTWGISTQLFQIKATDVDALYSTRHNTINLKIEDQTDTEIHFSGSILWNLTNPDYGLQEKQTEINDYSIVFEDGTWKIGSFR